MKIELDEVDFNFITNILCRARVGKLQTCATMKNQG